MKNLLILILLFSSSCSVIQLGKPTELHKKEKYQYKDLIFLPIEKLNLHSKENFQFLYIVNFNCKSNKYETLKGNNSFYIVENSIIDMPNFYTKLKGISKTKKFYYFSEKKYKNPNKEFEFFVKNLKKDFNIKQDAYFVEAIKKN